MMSRSVSRLTLKGMFLMTIAVGMTSSSNWGMGGVEIIGGAVMWPIGGEPPDDRDERSVFWGEKDLPGCSIAGDWSTHCWRWSCQRERRRKNAGQSGAYVGQAATERSVPERRGADGRKGRMGLTAQRHTCEVALLLALVIVDGVMLLLLLLLLLLRRGDGELGKIGRGWRGGHDGRLGRQRS
jgi:hypothetical protein